jgi:hypothetical protein
VATAEVGREHELASFIYLTDPGRRPLVYLRSPSIGVPSDMYVILIADRGGGYGGGRDDYGGGGGYGGGGYGGGGC